MKRRATTALVAWTAGTLVSAAAACSLGLDESLIDKAKDGGGALEDVASPDVETPDANVPETGPQNDASTTCSKDEECTTTDGCLKGKCDSTEKRCVYDVCCSAACMASACAAPAHTCGTAASYKLQAGQFAIDGQGAVRGATAVYPWLYVATQAGLVAFDVSNPASTKPQKVPVVGLGFVPTSIAASGSRVWLVGGASGPGPSRIELAYIDSPAQPFATAIPAVSVLATSPRAAEPSFVMGRGGGTALLYSSALATAVLEAPLVEPLTVAPTVIDAGASYVPNVVSGARLLLSTPSGTSISFELVDNAGLPDAGVEAPKAFSAGDAGLTGDQRSFARSSDGAVFFATGIVDGTPNIHSVRAFFVVAGDTAPIATAPAGIDIETYGGALPPDESVLGKNGATSAMVDTNTAMIAAEAHEGAAQTSVQFVQRQPLALVKERRALLQSPVTDVVAATGSNGIGYLVTQSGPGAIVYVFDPACAP